MWTFNGKPHLTVPRPRLIIPLSVLFFHLCSDHFRCEPRLPPIIQNNVRRAATANFFMGVRKLFLKGPHSLISADNNLGGSSCQGLFPGGHLGAPCSDSEGGIALSESSPVGAKILEEGWSKKKHKPIENRSSFLWAAPNQLPVRSGDRENRQDLEVLSDTTWDPINKQGSLERWTNLHHLFKAS